MTFLSRSIVDRLFVSDDKPLEMPEPPFEVWISDVHFGEVIREVIPSEVRRGLLSGLLSTTVAFKVGLLDLVGQCRSSFQSTYHRHAIAPFGIASHSRVVG
jgi:hypothetical protein